jgi:hypothetical protein
MADEQVFYKQPTNDIATAVGHANGRYAQYIEIDELDILPVQQPQLLVQLVDNPYYVEGYDDSSSALSLPSTTIHADGITTFNMPPPTPRVEPTPGPRAPSPPSPVVTPLSLPIPDSTSPTLVHSTPPLPSTHLQPPSPPPPLINTSLPINESLSMDMKGNSGNGSPSASVPGAAHRAVAWSLSFAAPHVKWSTTSQSPRHDHASDANNSIAPLWLPISPLTDSKRYELDEDVIRAHKEADDARLQALTLQLRALRSSQYHTNIINGANDDAITGHNGRRGVRLASVQLGGYWGPGGSRAVTRQPLPPTTHSKEGTSTNNTTSSWKARPPTERSSSSRITPPTMDAPSVWPTTSTSIRIDPVHSNAISNGRLTPRPPSASSKSAFRDQPKSATGPPAPVISSSSSSSPYIFEHTSRSLSLISSLRHHNDVTSIPSSISASHRPLYSARRRSQK